MTRLVNGALIALVTFVAAVPALAMVFDIAPGTLEALDAVPLPASELVGDTGGPADPEPQPPLVAQIAPVSDSDDRSAPGQSDRHRQDDGESRNERRDRDDDRETRGKDDRKEERREEREQRDRDRDEWDEDGEGRRDDREERDGGERDDEPDDDEDDD